MPMERKITNIVLRKTLNALWKSKAPVYRRAYEILSRPRRKRVAVNVSKINRYTQPNDVVLVPGKVLGAGDIDHPVTVAAFAFSFTAKEKIEKAGGRAIHILQLLRENPRGRNVKIII